MAPESERAMKCKWCDKPIYKVRRYNSADNEYFEQWAHELDDDATCTIMVEPNEPTLTCSEVVERLLNEALRHVGDAIWLDPTTAHAILHSWRERRVQELRDAFESLPQWDTRRVGMYEALNILESDEWREQIRKGAKHE